MVSKKMSLLRDLYVKRKDLVLPILEKTFLAVNSSLSTTLFLQLKNKEFREIVSASISPKDYSTAESFRNDYLCAEIASKYPHWDIGVDRAAVAVEKFVASEVQCKETNRRFSSHKTWSFAMTSVIHTACRKIEKVLGPFDWDEACTYFAFGPGSTTRLKRAEADSYYKLKGIPESTESNLAPSIAVLRYFNTWGSYVGGPDKPEVRVVTGNKVVTVPKNAKTDRVIAIEPCMNIFIQKGIGRVIRGRLKRVAVDLDDQTKNQRLAREGSLDGSLVTLDLSSASDTISKEVVRELLPPDWLDALNCARSERGVLPSGEVLTYQKFSSMGNGFTFELESLIFWALCSAVADLRQETDHRMAVYGDDIIVPIGIYPEVRDVLEFCGFTVNEKKTHHDGPFRESCGKHYFNGSDVTPIYIKDHIDSYPRYIWFANQSKRWSRHISYGYSGVLSYAYHYVIDQMSGYWKYPHIPDGIGDGALFGDFDEISPKKAPHGHQGYIAEFFTEQRDEFLPDDPAILLKSLYRLEQVKLSRMEALVLRSTNKTLKEVGSPLPLGVLSEKRKFRLVKRVCWRWPSYGPWQDT